MLPRSFRFAVSSNRTKLSTRGINPRNRRTKTTTTFNRMIRLIRRGTRLSPLNGTLWTRKGILKQRTIDNPLNYLRRRVTLPNTSVLTIRGVSVTRLLHHRPNILRTKKRFKTSVSISSNVMISNGKNRRINMLRRVKNNKFKRFTTILNVNRCVNKISNGTIRVTFLPRRSIRKGRTSIPLPRRHFKRVTNTIHDSLSIRGRVPLFRPHIQQRHSDSGFATVVPRVLRGY